MENQPEEKNEIPTPPPAKVSVRTMQSDIKSIQESGGQMPQPYIAEINPLAKEINESKEVSFQAPALGSNVSGYSGPEEPMFQTKPPSSLPPGKKQSQPKKTLKFPKKSKTFMRILGIIILAAILGFGGYYLTTNIIKGKRRRRLQSYPRFRKQKSSFPRRKKSRLQSRMFLYLTRRLSKKKKLFLF